MKRGFRCTTFTQVNLAISLGTFYLVVGSVHRFIWNDERTIARRAFNLPVVIWLLALVLNITFSSVVRQRIVRCYVLIGR